MFSSLSSIVQLVLAGVVGLLLGLLISTMFTREPKTPVEKSLPKELTDEGYSEASRLLFSPSAKKVITQLDGDFYRDFTELTPEQKKRVLRLLEGWNEWAGQKPAAQVPNASIPPMQAKASAAAEVDLAGGPFAAGVFSSIDPVVKQSMTGEAPKKDELSDLGIKQPEFVQPIPAVVQIGQPTLKPKDEPLTIVDQINLVIERLAAGTDLAQKAVHLADNGHEGVTVWVGAENFEGIDVIPYDEVKQLIKAAVAKWEEETEEKK